VLPFEKRTRDTSVPHFQRGSSARNSFMPHNWNGQSPESPCMLVSFPHRVFMLSYSMLDHRWHRSEESVSLGCDRASLFFGSRSPRIAIDRPWFAKLGLVIAGNQENGCEQKVAEAYCCTPCSAADGTCPILTGHRELTYFHKETNDDR